MASSVRRGVGGGACPQDGGPQRGRQASRPGQPRSQAGRGRTGRCGARGSGGGSVDTGGPTQGVCPPGRTTLHAPPAAPGLGAGGELGSAFTFWISPLVKGSGKGPGEGKSRGEWRSAGSAVWAGWSEMRRREARGQPGARPSPWVPVCQSWPQPTASAADTLVTQHLEKACECDRASRNTLPFLPHASQSHPRSSQRPVIRSVQCH